MIDVGNVVGFRSASRMRNLVFFLLCLVGLCACIEDMPPIRSGTVVYDSVHPAPSTAAETGPGPASRELSDGQVHALDQWLHAHRSNWDMLVYAPPRASISVALVLADETRSDLNLTLASYAGKGAPLLVLTRRDRDGKFMDVASRQLSNDDVAALEGLLAVRP